MNLVIQDLNAPKEYKKLPNWKTIILMKLKMTQGKETR